MLSGYFSAAFHFVPIYSGCIQSFNKLKLDFLLIMYYKPTLEKANPLESTIDGQIVLEDAEKRENADSRTTKKQTWQ